MCHALSKCVAHTHRMKIIYMGEDTTEFSQALLKEARKEAAEIVGMARHEAEHILANARAELDRVYMAEASPAKTQRAKLRYTQIVAAAELQAQRQLLLGQERLIVEVQERIKQRLLQLRNEPQYADILVSLVRQGLSELEGEAFEIIVAPEDRALVTAAMLTTLREQTGKTVTLATQSQAGITGAIVQRADQRVLCDNSLQAILQRQQHEIRLLVAQELFAGIGDI